MLLYLYLWVLLHISLQTIANKQKEYIVIYNLQSYHYIQHTIKDLWPPSLNMDHKMLWLFCHKYLYEAKEPNQYKVITCKTIIKATYT